MGRGDEALGKILLRGFLQTLVNDEEYKIDYIGACNGGSFLTCEDSPVLDLLQALEARGAQITTCGTCIDYHNLGDKLRIGGRGTMADSVKLMMSADKVIRV